LQGARIATFSRQARAGADLTRARGRCAPRRCRVSGGRFRRPASWRGVHGISGGRTS